VIEHKGRRVQASVAESGEVRTEIGSADASPVAVPLSRPELFLETVDIDGLPYELTAVSTGSTHTVMFVDRLPEDAEFHAVSLALEHHGWFPERTSIMWTQVIGTDHLRLRIWERGAGETLGCGTGSAAAAAVYLRREGRSGTVTVENPGGTLKLQMDAWDAPITAIGSAQVVFSGILSAGVDVSAVAAG
jgi:diaminopimelate epimerase